MSYGSGRKFFDQRREQFEQLYDIQSPRELLDEQERCYRLLPSETYADEFAASVLRKHWDTLLADRAAQPAAESRLAGAAQS